MANLIRDSGYVLRSAALFKKAFVDPAVQAAAAKKESIPEPPDPLPAALKNMGFTRAEVAFAIAASRGDVPKDAAIQDRVKAALLVLHNRGRKAAT